MFIMAAVKQITEVDGRKTSITLGNNNVALRAVSYYRCSFFNVGIHLSIVQGFGCGQSTTKLHPG